MLIFICSLNDVYNNLLKLVASGTRSGYWMSTSKQFDAAIYSVRQKKYPLKFFAIFLATARNLYMKFHTLITHSYSHKIAKQHCILFNYDKVIKFLRWPCSHFWCSRNVYRTKNAYFVMWQKIRRDLNNKIINSPILEVSIISFHAHI